MTDSETERVRGYYNQLANQYDASIGLFERLLLGDGRAWACSQARGDILEIGVGTGRNLQYYPTDARLVGIELSPGMLAVALRKARDLGLSIDLREGDATALPFEDASFDTVVGTLVLCTVPDDRRAVAEAARVLRPGGRLVLVEHVRSPLWPVRLLEQALDPVLVRLEGDHLLRDPLDYLGDSDGLTVESYERSKWGIVERVVARKA